MSDQDSKVVIVIGLTEITEKLNQDPNLVRLVQHEGHLDRALFILSNTWRDLEDALTKSEMNGGVHPALMEPLQQAMAADPVRVCCRPDLGLHSEATLNPFLEKHGHQRLDLAALGGWFDYTPLKTLLAKQQPNWLVYING